MTNREKLENAGIIEQTAHFTSQEDATIESLSQEEIDALISTKDKLGEQFFITYSPHNFVF